ncbi:hypothetical protein OJAV_G00202850 [Oryzias javanicus]|uniref:Uncharacterized protein n=1 Tax=Oryzias javanicus TaxID=123683 RepID=A0A3S2NRV3_ORYJA|nr:hypothetical protein OJAV_G00202850 [Oryzias javanicus]
MLKFQRTHEEEGSHVIQRKARNQVMVKPPDSLKSDIWIVNAESLRNRLGRIFPDMDVSIAVSLIRGQMGTVVERAVNVAVETVLAEMLKVVGAKFEELKTQVMLMKRDMAALQREKALKEKENDNIRAKLRYTELKLKYYRQGVEEELQQRASSSTLVRIYPPGFARVQGGEVLPTEPSPSCSAQRTPDSVLVKSSQECSSSQSTCRRASRAGCPSDTTCLDLMELRHNAPAEPLDSSADFLAERDVSPTGGPIEREWSISVGSHADGVDAMVTTPSIQNLANDSGPPPTGSSPSPPANSWSTPSTAAQVKQELHPQEEEEEEVICIKEEPEEQEVMQQSYPPQSEAPLLMSERKPSTSQMNLNVSVSSGGSNTYAASQLAASLPPGALPRQAPQPWTKDLSFYDEFKLRRNELRRRNLTRQRELEKELPQPLLANLVQERREKTRLRVARWRAKRKLQAYLNQTQAQAGAAAASPSGFPGQQLSAPSASRNQQRQNAGSFLCNTAANNMPVILPLISASSSPLILQCPSMLPNDQSVPSSSSSSSSSYTQVSLSQTQMFNSE